METRAPKGTVLVTGGAGFIGSHLVDALLSDGWRVTVVDNFDSFYDPALKRENVAHHFDNAGYQLVQADIRDRHAMRRLLHVSYDVIVHLAARAGVRPSVQDPAVYHDVNVLGTQNVLELARELNVRQFVFASSSSVYGLNASLPWTEDDLALLPISPYASTKVNGELLGRIHSDLYGTRFVALRLFSVYGPRQRPDLAIRKFSSLILKGDRIPVYGDGRAKRDYSYVSDIVQGICSAMSYDCTQYEIVNLGTGRCVDLIELIHTLEELIGTRAKVEWRPNQAGDVPQTLASVTKARRILLYEPRTELKTGLKHFLDWFLGRPDDPSLANDHG